MTSDISTTTKIIFRDFPFDFIFIDAEKGGYNDYYEWAVNNAREGGIIAAHNVLARGRVMDELDSNGRAHQMREFNVRTANDTRVISTIYPGGDGMLIALKTC